MYVRIAQWLMKTFFFFNFSKFVVAPAVFELVLNAVS